MASAPTLIRGAEVVDGSGAPRRRADVLVEGGSISAVSETGGAPALPPETRVLDASGLVLAPGFVDVHSHADNAPLLDRDDTAKIMQGVTTEVVGNCGMSLAPRERGNAAVLEQYALRIFPPVDWAWHGFAELVDTTDARGYVTNYVPLVGHHSLRIAAMGMRDDAPTAQETRTMQRLLEEALEAGVHGLSTGLIYPPGLFAATDEVVDLASQLPAGRIYATHMRGESGRLLASVDEALEVGRRAGCRVQISHLKASGRGNWGLVRDALVAIDRARQAGVDVRQDVYPYTAGSTMLTAALPPWFQEGGDGRVLDRLRDADCLARLRAELAAGDAEWENFVHGAGWDGVVVASSASHRFDGRSLQEIADAAGADPFDILVEILLTERLRASMIVHSMAEGDLRSALEHPATMVGSDGLPPGTGGRPHPRGYGTFPRVLARYVRERRVLGLEEAVRRMTSLPAETFGLTDRGLLEPGRAADVVALDPDAVRDLADYATPVRDPEGIGWVMQNGQVVVEAGAYVGPRCGRRLRPRG